MIQWPGKYRPEPGIGITKSRLTGFQSNHARNYGAIYLPTDTAYQFALDISFGSHEHVTGGGTHDFTEMIWLNLPTHSTHVRIESTNSNNHIGRQAKAVSPCST